MDHDNLVTEGTITEADLKKGYDEENSIQNKQLDEITLNVEYDMNDSNFKIVQDDDEEKPKINSYSDVLELDIEYDMNDEGSTNDNGINPMKDEKTNDFNNYTQYDTGNNIKIVDEEENIDLNNIEIYKELKVSDEELDVEKVTTKFEEEKEAHEYKDIEVYESLNDIKTDEKSKLNNNYKEYYEISWK